MRELSAAPCLKSGFTVLSHEQVAYVTVRMMPGIGTEQGDEKKPSGFMMLRSLSVKCLEDGGKEQS